MSKQELKVPDNWETLGYKQFKTKQGFLDYLVHFEPLDQTYNFRMLSNPQETKIKVTSIQEFEKMTKEFQKTKVVKAIKDNYNCSLALATCIVDFAIRQYGIE